MACHFLSASRCTGSNNVKMQLWGVVSCVVAGKSTKRILISVAVRNMVFASKLGTYNLHTVCICKNTRITYL